MGVFNLARSIDGRAGTGSRAHTAQIAKPVDHVVDLRWVGVDGHQRHGFRL